MNNVYLLNHKPKFNFNCDIRYLIEMNLPKELYNLDILDGSPPCSSFSIAGNREKDWGKEKKFKEGQKKQVLDTLFFDFINLANKLKPKLVISENVKGLLQGGAKDYVRKIYKEFDKAGYYTQHYLLKGEELGLPQKRHRVFFVSVRKDLIEKANFNIFTSAPELELNFNYKEIPFEEIESINNKEEIINKQYYSLYQQMKEGENLKRLTGKYFNTCKAHRGKPLNTITSSERQKTFLVGTLHYNIYRKIDKNEIILASSFPMDFDFNNVKVGYVCGMSVPPLMTYRLLTEILKQWNLFLKM